MNKKKSFQLKIKPESFTDIIKKYGLNINNDNVEKKPPSQINYENILLNEKVMNEKTNVNQNILNEMNVSKTKNITYIQDILEKEPENIYLIYDEKRRGEKCILTMLDYVLESKLPEKSNIKCFWCRNNFNSSPLGCPIKFVNSIIEKCYTSNITKEKYYIKENVINKNNYFLTDGIFCSFNCISSFINDNNNKPLYKESRFLLSSMILLIFNKKIDIKPSFHWRLLKEYGGNLSIEEYRKFHNEYDYKEMQYYISDLSCMKPISKIFKIKN